MMSHHFRSFLLPCALLVGCTTAQAETDPAPAPVPAATLTVPPCDSVYDVVGAMDDQEESESIDSVVFTDTAPFECELTGPTQTVRFDFNSSAVDPKTDCEYSLARRHKGSGSPVGTSEVLSCSNATLHYGVVATPVASDPDCSGLGQVVVDPKIILKQKNCGV